MPEGRQFFDYLNGLETLLCVAKVVDYFEALGTADFLPSVPVISLGQIH